MWRPGPMVLKFSKYFCYGSNTACWLSVYFWNLTKVTIWHICSTMHTLRWRHHERDCVSNHQPRHCYSTNYSGADQRKHQSSASLAFVQGIHWRPVNSPHKWPVTRKTVLGHSISGSIVSATGIDAWASRVKCPARFVSHLHDICIYMSCL